jgi:hypothetical protein
LNWVSLVFAKHGQHLQPASCPAAAGPEALVNFAHRK